MTQLFRTFRRTNGNKVCIDINKIESVEEYQTHAYCELIITLTTGHQYFIEEDFDKVIDKITNAHHQL